MNQKIKSMLQSSDKGSYYNYDGTVNLSLGWDLYQIG